MANPAFHHWAVLVKCNNRDGVKKEAVFEGLKEDGKVIKKQSFFPIGLQKWLEVPSGKDQRNGIPFAQRNCQD